MDLADLKMKILEKTGWTTTKLDDVLVQLKKENVLFRNEEFTYRMIAKDLDITIEPEYKPIEYDRLTLTIKEAEELDDGDYCDIEVLILKEMRAIPAGTIAFMDVTDSSDAHSLKAFPDDWKHIKDAEVDKVYNITAIRVQHDEEYGFGLMVSSATKIVETKKKIKPKITNIIDLEESWIPFTIKGVVTDLKESGIQMGFCSVCDRYVTYASEEDDSETTMCENCQEPRELNWTLPMSSNISDESGTLKVRYPPFEEILVVDGNIVTVIGNYNHEKKLMYIDNVFQIAKDELVTLDLNKFIDKVKPKCKRKSKKKSKDSKNDWKKFNMDRAVADYAQYQEAYGVPEEITIDSALRLWSVFGLTESIAQRFIDVLIDSYGEE